jgi:hypothetical protein
MKLYCTPGGTWAGTERACNAALKLEGIDPKTVERKQVDVPTSKPELLEFLTFHGVNPIGGHARSPLATPPAPAAPVPAAPTTVPQAPDLDALFAAAPLPKRVQLAVGLLDHMEARLR